MDKLILITVGLDEFSSLIREVVSEELRKKGQEDSSEKLLSVKEACKMFQPAVSPQTLHTWTKEGLIPMQKIGGKNFYKHSEVINAGKRLQKYKHHFI